MAGELYNDWQAIWGRILGNLSSQSDLIPYLNSKVTATLTANGTASIPAGYMILGIVLKGNNSNAVTGGIRIGTSAAGVDVVAAQAVAGDSIQAVPTEDILLKVFSTTAAQTLYIEAVTAWNSASVTYYIITTKITA